MTNKIELEIVERGAFADGHEFGATGTYERVRGRAHFAVDPTAAAQAGIVDIDKAQRNAASLVEFTADVFILKPLDPARGNRRLFFGYGNRGNKRELQFFNDARNNFVIAYIIRSYTMPRLSRHPLKSVSTRIRRGFFSPRQHLSLPSGQPQGR